VEIAMRTVNIHAAKTNLSSLLEEVEKGEEIVIARAGKPVAKLVPLVEQPKRRRQLGLLRGKIWVSPDLSWEPDSELQRLFEEGDPSFRSALDDYLDEVQRKKADETDKSA
jgi:prevent-host-death family protein